MSYVSYYALALSIVKLLLMAAGLLLVAFDWSASRRREFLYIYFNDEKPGFDYFAAARRRRTQYTRLLAAFSVLLIGDFISVIMNAAVSPIEEWEIWIRWWNSDWHLAPHLSAATELASKLEVWNISLTVIGLFLLAIGFLHRPSQERPLWAERAAMAFIAVWSVFIIIVIFGLFGTTNILLVNIGMLTLLAIITVGVIIRAWKSSWEKPKLGLLHYNPTLIGACFVLLWLGIWGGYIFKNPTWMPFFGAIAFVPLVWTVAKGVLSEYESIEASRHRLGREHQTVITFLKRIGSAFTTNMDLGRVLHLILESALDTTDAAAGAIYLYNKETGFLETRDVLNFFPPLYTESIHVGTAGRTEGLSEEMKKQTFRLGEGILGQVAQEGKARIVDDVRASGIMLGGTAEYLRNRSMLVVPLRIREEPLGVMAVLCKQRGSFEPEDRLLLRALADQGALFINNAILADEVAAQERLRRDLQIARDIQLRLLPERCPEIDGYEIAALGRAATEVGGDYYDFFWVDDTHLAIVVADVSGKGVHAALIAATLRSVFRTQSSEFADARSALCKANDFISEDLRSDMFVTCSYGVLDIENRIFEWARAGHEPLVISHRGGETEVRSPNGFALGVVPSPDFGELLEVETLQLQSSDHLLLFTDGLTEAMSESGEEFGLQRILNVMRDNQNDTISPIPSLNKPATADIAACLSATSGLKVIKKAVANHVGNAAQSDDLTVVYLEVK